MAADRDSETEDSADGQSGFPDLVAPRRMFKRKKRGNLLLALKIGLPLIAVVCVAYIVIWSRIQLPNITINPVAVTENAAKPTDDVTVSKVKYDGVDAKNRPFSITADRAIQPDTGKTGSGDATQNQQQTAGKPADANTVINLKTIEADMTLVDGAWVALTADNGIYNRDAGTVDLSGNVTLFHDTGLQFNTDAATVDLKNDTAKGDQPVEGQRPDGELAAQGFEVRDEGNTVVFTGRAYLKLYPKSGSSDSGG